MMAQSRSRAARVGGMGSTGFLALVVATMLQVGCRQGEGERCQVNSDCDTQLQCCITDDSDAIVQGLGFCTLPQDCELTVTDAGVTETDASTDAAAIDAAGEDATEMDAAGNDATASDAAAGDAAEDVALDSASDGGGALDGATTDAQTEDGAADAATDAGS